MQLKGIHHITAIASDAAENYRFYTRVLGLRMIKTTVNFDDPQTYHLYFGDYTGTPGTILTFFPWEGMRRGRPGSGEISAIAFHIPHQSTDYWMKRLADFQIPAQHSERFGETLISFSDPHGLQLELVGSEASPQVQIWKGGPVPEGHSIRGFHSATATVNRLEPTAELLSEILGLRKTGEEADRTRYGMSDRGAPGLSLDIAVDDSLPPAQLGGGSVHHIAFRATDDDEQKYWQSAVSNYGLQVTPIIDRNYFRSIYFREAGGILFEIATDPPGFSIDEPVDQLGSGLMLPKRYEDRRSEIEAHLPPLYDTSTFEHIYLPPQNRDKDDTTIVPLHGTGGNEKDLLALTWEIFGNGAAVVSPRGRVLENGMPRFFRRLAEGVFDAEDVRRQSQALSDFLIDAARQYGRHSSPLTALGYSNGANIAAAMILLRPEVFSSAILLRPMLPLVPEALPDLKGLPVLIARGDADPVIPAAGTDQLIDVLRQAGADLTVQSIAAGHQITADDIQAARQWLRQQQDAGQKNVA